MVRDPVEQTTRHPETIALDATASEAATIPGVAGSRPLSEPFPYEQLLAYFRRELRDPIEVAKIEGELRGSLRWRAHLESLRFLDMERAAAKQDGVDLQGFQVENASQLCLYAAISDGELFARATVHPGTIAAQTRREWARHTLKCVYCGRMRRCTMARLEAENAGLSRGEVLLRDWLLGRHYADALRDRTDEIIKAYRRKNLPQAVERLPPDQRLLVVEHKVKKVPLEELARTHGGTVSVLQDQITQAIAKLPGLYRDSILAEIEQLFQPTPVS